MTDRQFNNDPVDLPMSVLFGKPPKMHRQALRRPPVSDGFDASAVSLPESLERVLTFPAVASKSFLITIGDRSVTGYGGQGSDGGPLAGAGGGLCRHHGIARHAFGRGHGDG